MSLLFQLADILSLEIRGPFGRIVAIKKLLCVGVVKKKLLWFMSCKKLKVVWCKPLKIFYIYCKVLLSESRKTGLDVILNLHYGKVGF